MPELDARDGVGDLARHELEAAPRALVVEQDAGDGVEPEALAVVHRDPVPVHLRHAVRAPRIEGRRLALRRLDDLAEHLARAGLIEPRLRRRLLHRLEHARDAERGELAGEHRLGPRRLRRSSAPRGCRSRRAACRATASVERRLVEQVGRHQLDPVDEVRDALVRRRRAAAHDADDAVALREQQLGEVGAVLARDAGDQRGRHAESRRERRWS